MTVERTATDYNASYSRRFAGGGLLGWWRRRQRTCLIAVLPSDPYTERIASHSQRKTSTSGEPLASHRWPPSNFPPSESRNKRHRWEAEKLPAGHVILEAIDKYAGGAFNPDDVRILVAAFDDAWRSLLASGITFESDRESKAVRDLLAKHIIEQARYGERDRRRLRDGALLQYAQSKLKNKPRK